MVDFLNSHYNGIFAFLVVVSCITVGNLFSIKKLSADEENCHIPEVKVSVLVPARNEELNISNCLISLLEQDFADFEVCVLNDGSTDSTAKIIESLCLDHERLRVIEGKPLPKGWIGKNWACWQLSQSASGDMLLFTDADTVHEPNLLKTAVKTMKENQLDLLSVTPKQEVVTWSEKLLIPVFLWSIFSFLPMFMAKRVKSPMLSAAVGQFMMFEKNAYVSTGGHLSIRQSVIDDLALVRLIKRMGFRWDLMKGHEYLKCRMYRNSKQVIEGFSKNLFAVFNYNAPVFLFIWIWITVVFCEPPLVLGLLALGIIESSALMYKSVSCIAMCLFIWFVSLRAFGFRNFYSFFYPASVAFSFVIALRSLVKNLRGTASWKGRKLERQPIRWIKSSR